MKTIPNIIKTGLFILFLIIHGNISGTNNFMDYYDNSILNYTNQNENEKYLNNNSDFKTPSEKSYQELNKYDLSRADIVVAQIDEDWIELGGIPRAPIKDGYLALLFLIPIYLFFIKRRQKSKT